MAFVSLKCYLLLQYWVQTALFNVAMKAAHNQVLNSVVQCVLSIWTWILFSITWCSLPCWMHRNFKGILGSNSRNCFKYSSNKHFYLGTSITRTILNKICLRWNPASLCYFYTYPLVHKCIEISTFSSNKLWITGSTKYMYLKPNITCYQAKGICCSQTQKLQTYAIAVCRKKKFLYVNMPMSFVLHCVV